MQLSMVVDRRFLVAVVEQDHYNQDHLVVLVKQELDCLYNCDYKLVLNENENMFKHTDRHLRAAYKDQQHYTAEEQLVEDLQHILHETPLLDVLADSSVDGPAVERYFEHCSYLIKRKEKEEKKRLINVEFTYEDTCLLSQKRRSIRYFTCHR